MTKSEVQKIPWGEDITSLNNILKINKNAPENLLNFVSGCKSADDLLIKLGKDSSYLLSIIQYMTLTKESEPLAARLLYKALPCDMSNTAIAKVRCIEKTLRNHCMLNFKIDSNITLRTSGKDIVKAHRSILDLESPYFAGMRHFKECKQDKFDVETTYISAVAYQKVVEYLYLSDEKRKTFVSTVDKKNLPEMLELASIWNLKELAELCDNEFFNHLYKFNIEKEVLQGWLDLAKFHCAPKLLKLLKFLERNAPEGDVNVLLEQMNNNKQAALLALKCTPIEIKLFATQKTEFGRACQIPPGTFGKAEWEQYFGTIKDEHVPPLPFCIHEILKSPDPFDFTKTVGENYTFFLVPKRVNGKKLTINYMEKLAKNAKGRKIKFVCSDKVKTIIGGKTPVGKSRWVMLRNDVILDSRGKSCQQQKELLKGTSCVFPKALDAMILNILKFIRSENGKQLHGLRTYTRCQEVSYDDFNNYQHFIVGIAQQGIDIGYDTQHDFRDRANNHWGLVASWKFYSASQTAKISAPVEAGVVIGA